MIRPQGEVRELTVVLTAEELEDRGADLAAAVRNADQEEQHLEGRKKAWSAELAGLKEDVKTARAEVSKLAEIVRTGKDKRDVSCTWKYALAEGWRFLTRDDTGERIASRKLKDEERQLSITAPPFAEPTPDELALWLAALPVNEPDDLGEGHAETVTPEERLVGALLDPAADESFGPSSDELTGEEQTRAYEQEMWEADAEEGEDEDEVDAAIDAIEAGEIVVPPLEKEF